MNPRTAYQLQILEKVGAPLLAAAQSRLTAIPQEQTQKQTQEQAQDAGATRSEAAIVAELLARAVQSGLSLAQVMDVREQGADGESVRLALSALGASLVAGLYTQNGHVPGEADMQRQVAALSAALTFADNFAPAAANTGRLQDIEAGRIPGDETQVMIQCLLALSPVVSVIAEYAFGRTDKKMLLEVTARLVQKAGQLAQRLLPQAALSEQKFAELGFLRALGLLYSEAHRAETRRVLALNEAARAELTKDSGGYIPLDHLWAEFDRHAALLDVLGQSLLPAMMAAAGASSQTPVTAPPVQPAQQAQPAVNSQQSAPVMPQTGGSSPLAFFKNPRSGTADPASDEETDNT